MFSDVPIVVGVNLIEFFLELGLLGLGNLVDVAAVCFSISKQNLLEGDFVVTVVIIFLLEVVPLLFGFFLSSLEIRSLVNYLLGRGRLNLSRCWCCGSLSRSCILRGSSSGGSCRCCWGLAWLSLRSNGRGRLFIILNSRLSRCGRCSRSLSRDFSGFSGSCFSWCSRTLSRGFAGLNCSGSSLSWCSRSLSRGLAGLNCGCSSLSRCSRL